MKFKGDMDRFVNQEVKQSMTKQDDITLFEESDIATNLIYALGTAFDSILYIDINTEIYYMLYKDNNGVLQMKKSEDYTSKAYQQINKVVHKDHYEEVKDLYMPSDVKNVLKDVSNIESTHLRWNGIEYRWVRMLIQVAERVNGEVTKVVYAFKDIHEKKLDELSLNAKLSAALDESKKAYEVKSQFLSNISHDLRTPMKAIMGISAIMKTKDNLTKYEIDEYLERIDLASENMLDLVNSILDMSKVSNPKLKINNFECLIGNIVKDIEAIIRVQANEKQQKLDIKCNCLEHVVKMDAVKVRRILLNVLSNAVKYTDVEGDISLEINESNGKYQFVIEDNGMGMSKEFVDNVYEPFERESRTRYLDGVGLGMSIVKRLVDLLNGEILIDSKIGEGTKIIIDLPLEKVDVPEKIQEEIKENKKDYSDYNILVVEDNEINLFILTEVLGEFGCNIDVALDGLEAIAKVAGSKENYYDLIIMDMKMPNMDGDIATKNIRLLDNREDVKEIPIIIASADACVINQEEIYANGVTGYVIKPIDYQKLEHILEKYLKK